MRQTTRRIVDAFMLGKNLKLGNSRTLNDAIYLHNNKIAEWREGVLWISNAGWFSRTTKDRLNGLSGVYIRQENYQWYLNGELWDGNWTRINLYMISRNAVNNSNNTNEPEFDLTSTWVTSNGYSYARPNYAIWHSNNKATLESIERGLRELGVQSRRYESDTHGVWRPNYFIVVRPEDFHRSLTTVNDAELSDELIQTLSTNNQ